MRILAISDIHGAVPKFPNRNLADVLVISGDLTQEHKHDYQRQANFINTKFSRFCKDLLTEGVVKHVVVCAGNHDMVWERSSYLVNKDLPFTYLQDSCVVIDGVSFWGTPWTSPFLNWGFNADETKRNLAFSCIPEGVDVLLSHGPPKLGLLGHTGNSDEGDSALLSQLKRIKPKLVVCGHIHEAGGLIEKLEHANGEHTVVANCSVAPIGLTTGLQPSSVKDIYLFTLTDNVLTYTTLKEAYEDI